VDVRGQTERSPSWGFMKEVTFAQGLERGEIGMEHAFLS
jgi:hypothetical protein